MGWHIHILDACLYHALLLLFVAVPPHRHLNDVSGVDVGHGDLVSANVLKVAHLGLDLFVDVVVKGLPSRGVGVASALVLVEVFGGLLGHLLGEVKLNRHGALQGFLLLGGQPVGIDQRLREHVWRHRADHALRHGVYLPRPLLEVCPVTLGYLGTVLHLKEVMGEVVNLLVDALEHLALVGLAKYLAEAEGLDA